MSEPTSETSLLGASSAPDAAPDQTPAADQAAGPKDGAPTDAPADGNAPDAGDKAKDTPREYVDFTMPEGLTLDKALADKATPLFQEAGLSQEQAQKMVDLYAEQMKAQTQANMDAWVGMNKTNADALRADAEIGGAVLKQSLADGWRMVEKFGSPLLAKSIREPGAEGTDPILSALGNHPEFARLLVRMSKAIAEDKPVVGGAGGGPETNMAKRMYPNMS